MHRVRRLSDECPVPKSSTATLSPRLCSSSRIGAVTRSLLSMADSVISTIILSGLRPKDSIVSSTWRIMVGRQKLAGRLIET